MEHSIKNKGVIVINLGSPDSYEVKDVRKYLKQFLTDKRVIDLPAPLRHLLVRGIIAPVRGPKSAHAYKTVWTDKGSPLKVYTEDFCRDANMRTFMPLVYCMRYGNPTIQAALHELEAKTEGLKEVLIAPMYPHYAMSSYESAAEYVKRHLRVARPGLKMKVLKPFYSERGYISSLANSIKEHMTQDFDGYLFSYHGLPERHLSKTGGHEEFCYKKHVTATTDMTAAKLELPADKVFQSFQSRLGKGWVQPYTDKMLREFPKKGIKKLLVVCPAFVTDCLETLEEISMQGRDIFMNNGGEQYVAVPCLNNNAEWVQTFANYCNQNDMEYSHLWNEIQG